MRYAISYDLNNPGNNYQKLYEALAQLGAERVLLSEWVTNRRQGASAERLCDWIWTFMDGNDRVLVTCLDSPDWAGRNLRANPNNV